MKAQKLEERVQQTEVEVMTLLSEKQKVDSVLEELDDMAAHCASQEYRDKKIIEEMKNHNINLNVEIGALLVEKDLVEEQFEQATDNLEDMVAHCASQEYKYRKTIEEMNETIQQMSAMGFNVHEKSASPAATPKQKAMEEDSQSPIGNPYEFKMAIEEDIENTINVVVSLIQKEQEYQAKKKRPKPVEPSSLTKRVHERGNRVEKKLEGFYYERKRKKEQQTKAS